jgi:hypothetical protein
VIFCRATESDLPSPRKRVAHFDSQSVIPPIVYRMIYSSLLVSFFLLLPSVWAERYTFDLSNPKQASLTLGSETGSSSSSITRQVQSSTNENPCNVEGSSLICQYDFAAGGLSNETMISFRAVCDFNSITGFDFRRATNCGCIAKVVPKFSPSKECPCSVCAAGFGDTPVSVDCSEYETNNATTAQARESGSASVPAVAVGNITNSSSVIDPYIFSTCTSIDCSGACNGTCALSCESSGEVCRYCENYSGEGAPTAAPVGSGDGSLKNFGESAAELTMARSVALVFPFVILSLFF